MRTTLAFALALLSCGAQLQTLYGQRPSPPWATVSTLPSAASAVLGMPYIWTGATTANTCPSAGAGGSGGSAKAGCVTYDGATWTTLGGAGLPISDDGSTLSTTRNFSIGTTVPAYFPANSLSLAGYLASIGFSLAATNPSIGNDVAFRRALDLSVTMDGSTSNPTFTTEAAANITLTAPNGQALYGGGTNAKKTFIPLFTTLNATGSGQRIHAAQVTNCYGMSDCAGESKSVTFAGGNIAGDEGQGWSVVNYLQQQPSLVTASVGAAGVTRTSCNTTVTQTVTASKDPQTVTVASTVGCVATSSPGDKNGWVVFGQEAATGTPNETTMQITAVGSGTLTGTIVGNYVSGATITPATVVPISNTNQFGQDRVLVNLSTTPVTAGTVSSISGAGFTGSGTSWSTGMVGGTTLVPGVISLASDDFNGSPFTMGSPLKSWYQINMVSSGTSLGIFSYSTGGDTSYHGNGAGGYTIRPGAKILKVVQNGYVVLETNTFTWNPTDIVEVAITPYPDISGFQYKLKPWTPGGVRRSFMTITNEGARTIQTGFDLTGNMATGSGADTVAWDIGYRAGKVNTGFATEEAATGIAFRAKATPTSVLTQQPCYAFIGGNINGSITGLCADYTLGTMFFKNGSNQIFVPIVGGNLGVTNGALTTGNLQKSDASGRTVDAGLSIPAIGSPSAGDQIPITTTSSSAGAWSPIPNCPDTSGQHLNFSSHAFTCGTGGGGVAATSVVDTNSASVILTSAATTPVNQITAANAATGINPSLSATGSDAQINLDLAGKGASRGGVRLLGPGSVVVAATTDGVGDAFLFGNTFYTCGAFNASGCSSLGPIKMNTNVVGATGAAGGLVTAQAWRGYGLELSSNAPIGFSSTTTADSGTYDSGIGRAAAGVVKITDGSAVLGKIAVSQSTPAASSDACTAGSIWADASFIYACTASGTIKRAALSTF